MWRVHVSHTPPLKTSIYCVIKVIFQIHCTSNCTRWVYYSEISILRHTRQCDKCLVNNSTLMKLETRVCIYASSSVRL